MGGENRLQQGLDEMERQHAELMEILATLRSRIGQGRPAADLERMLLLFQEHIRNHFRSEERMMRDLGYPEEAYQQHCRDHSEFLDHLAELLMKLQRDRDALRDRPEKKLLEWLEGHVKWEDEAMERELRAHFAGAHGAEAGS